MDAYKDTESSSDDELPLKELASKIHNNGESEDEIPLNILASKIQSVETEHSYHTVYGDSRDVATATLPGISTYISTATLPSVPQIVGTDTRRDIGTVKQPNVSQDVGTTTQLDNLSYVPHYLSTIPPDVTRDVDNTMLQANVPHDVDTATLPDVPQRDGTATLPDVPQRDGTATLPDVPQRDGTATLPDVPQRDGTGTLPDVRDVSATILQLESTESTYMEYTIPKDIFIADLFDINVDVATEEVTGGCVIDIDNLLKVNQDESFGTDDLNISRLESDFNISNTSVSSEAAENFSPGYDIEPQVSNASVSLYTQILHEPPSVVTTCQDDFMDEDILSENSVDIENASSESDFEPQIFNGSIEVSNFSSPRLSRRRTRDEKSWQANVRKRRRADGLEYINKTGKRVPEKKCKMSQCKCKFKCFQTIPEDSREATFRSYWSKSYEQQRHFIKTNAVLVLKKRNTKSEQISRRKNTIEYFLPCDGKRRQVCKKTFLCTLAIGERTVAYTLKKKRQSECTDKRGSHPSTRKISEPHKEYIRQHIKSFPIVESHYCRKTTQRRYLNKDLSIRKTYDLYLKQCVTDNRIPQKFWLYDSIFASEFNFGFHVPKKDMCTFCDTYRKLSETEKVSQRSEYEMHESRKIQARDQKSLDKDRSSLNTSIKTVNFDLQKVLITPKSHVGEVFYSRKLATYNFTIFDLVSKETKCNMWWETEAKKGSNEIASCLLKYNTSVGTVDELNYYSDSCTGQQRNLPFSTMCLYSVVNLPIKQISHYYFERGHSQMEGDSVHATIENATKNSELYVPSDWFTAIVNAKRTEPKYKVLQLQNQDVLDFKDFSANIVLNRSKTDAGELVKWNKIHCFRYKQSQPTKIFFKYEIAATEFQSITIHRGRNKRNMIAGYDLKPAYSSTIPMSVLKYRDLQNLCKKGIIPAIHHDFYAHLPYAGSASNRLPEPNESDDSDIE